METLVVVAIVGFVVYKLFSEGIDEALRNFSAHITMISRKTKFYLLAGFLILAILNPPEYMHDNAVVFTRSFDIRYSPDAIYVLKARTSRVNFIFFSMTIVHHWGDTKIRTIGIGILGQVYIFDKAYEKF